MSDVTPEAAPPAEAIAPSAGAERVSPQGMVAIQGEGLDGAGEVKDTASAPNTLNASSFKPETKAALAAQGLDDPDSVLADQTGGKAEETARLVLKQEGLPQGDHTEPLKDVVPGHYDNRGHGLDLVGVNAKGQPVPIEVKKRSDPAQDSLGQDSAELSPEALKLKEDILRERTYNPAMRVKGEALADSAAKGMPELDPELSNEQMAGLWTRDAWLKLIDNPDQRAALSQAGVAEEYLNKDNLKNAYSPQWNDILHNRTTVIVSGSKDDVTNTLARQAAFKRGFDVSVINLKA